MWFCESCNHKLYEEYFHLHDIEKDFPRVFEHFYRGDESSAPAALRPPQSGADAIRINHEGKQQSRIF